MVKDFLDPKQNPFIQLGDEDGNSRPANDGETLSEDLEPRIPMGGYSEKKKAAAAASSPPDPAGGEGRTEADNLERDVLGVMADMTGSSYEIQVEDGGIMPLFNIMRNADGKLEVKTPEGETKDFSALTQLERKLIQHDLKTRKEFWGKRIG